MAAVPAKTVIEQFEETVAKHGSRNAMALKRPVDGKVCPWYTKGSLFNVGYQMTKASHDYMVLHDVDQVPERRENAYAWRDEPTLLLGATSQWQYKVSSIESHVVGGAFQISHAEYADVGGYSNVFEGWGMEDHNMGWRVRKRDLY